MNARKFFPPLLLALVALTSLACSLGSLAINGNTATLDITLSEDQVNEWIDRSVTQVKDSSDAVFEQVTQVEMHDGYVRVFGVTENNEQGSFDVAVSAENGFLKVAIVAVDIPGWEMGDERIERMNRELQQGLDQSVIDANGDVRYLDAQVSEGNLRLKVEAKLR